MRVHELKEANAPRVSLWKRKSGSRGDVASKAEQVNMFQSHVLGHARQDTADLAKQEGGQ